MSVRRQFARDAAILSVQAILQRVLGIMTSVILARGLSAVELGVLNAIQSTASNAYGLLRLGVDVATHVNLAEAVGSADGARRGRVFAAGLLLLSGAALLAAAACWVLAGWLARVVFDQPALEGWLRLASLLVLAQFGTQFSYSALAGLQSFGRLARIVTVVAVTNVVVTAVGIWGAGLAGAVAAAVTTALLGAVWLGMEGVRSLKLSGSRLHVAGWTGEAARLLRLGGPFYLTGLVLVPVTYGLQGLLTRTGGLEEMGYLRVMLSISALVTFLPISITGAAISSLAAIRTAPDQDGAAYMRHAALNLKLIWLLCLLIVLVLEAVLPTLVYVLFGPEYAPAVSAFRWGLLGAALLSVEGVLGQVFFTSRRVWVVFGLLAGRGGALAALGWLWIPGGGVRGYLMAEAVSLALSVGIGTAGFLWIARREVGQAKVVAPLLAVAVLTGVAALVVLPLRSAAGHVLLPIGLLALTLGVGYGVVLHTDERLALHRAMRGLLRRIRRPPHV